MLTKHIAFLLQRYDCVIVPKLGGFVAHESTASHAADTYTFTPPRRVIGFNPELKHNDGLLVESYMKALKINYREAKLRVENDIEGLLIQLKESKSVSIEQVGVICINDSGHVEFQRNKSDLLNSSFYGLPELRILPHAQIRREGYPAPKQPQPESNVVYFRVNQTLLKNIATVAAIVVLVLCISFPVNNTIDPSLLKAGFMPLDTVIEQEAELLVAQPMAEIIKVVEVPETPVAAVESPAPATPKPTVATAQPKQQVPYYYIIIESHTSTESANAGLKRLKSKGFAAAGIVTGNGRSRIYSEKFGTKEEADKKLSYYNNRLNRNDVWVLKSK